MKISDRIWDLALSEYEGEGGYIRLQSEKYFGDPDTLYNLSKFVCGSNRIRYLSECYEYLRDNHKTIDNKENVLRRKIINFLVDDSSHIIFSSIKTEIDDNSSEFNLSEEERKERVGDKDNEKHKEIAYAYITYFAKQASEIHYAIKEPYACRYFEKLSHAGEVCFEKINHKLDEISASQLKIIELVSPEIDEEETGRGGTVINKP